jgi:hypothetical protein
MMTELLDVFLVGFMRHPVSPAIAKRGVILYASVFVLETEVGINCENQGV